MENQRWIKGAFLDGSIFKMKQCHQRNQFYDRVFKDSVQGKHCVDVGFGSGLLTYLAIKHGAEHVTAYEHMPDRYEMGKYLVTKLGLSNKITLHNETFSKNLLTDSKFDLIYHEIMDSAIWGENLFESLLWCNTVPIIPSQYECEYYVQQISQEAFDRNAYWEDENLVWNQYYQICKGSSWPEDPGHVTEFKNLPEFVQHELAAGSPKYRMLYKFDPGVDFNVEYISGMEELAAEWIRTRSDEGVYSANNFTVGECQTVIKSGKKIGSYHLDTNKMVLTINDSTGQRQIENFHQDVSVVELFLDAKVFPDGPIAIIPKYTIGHGIHKLVLNDTVEWGSHSVPGIVLKENLHNICLKTILRTGRIFAYFMN